MNRDQKAIFLSYAREDAAAARRIAEALRSHGLEVWFDENELRGGDSWDAKIRRQIDDCTLFVPIISAHTDQRAKGYFRLEWKLAVDQTHLRAEGAPFLAPVVIDETSESGAVVPAEFMKVQWTRVPGALPSTEFVAQIKRLLGSERGTGISPVKSRPEAHAGPIGSPGRDPADASGYGGQAARATPGRRNFGRWSWAALAFAVIAIAFFALRPAPNTSASAASATSPTPAAQPPTDLAPAKSVAVLPFANLSAEAGNEFFADGVQDDIITNLAKIHDLTVISRTSTLAYRDTASRNMKKIAAELGVATVLEGSVRRVGNKVHMNAQLIDARTDAHLWADTFDGDASDIFALQASLAQKIAAALKVTLTGSEKALIEKRPTQNQAAYELYLKAKLQEESLTTRSSLGRYEQVAAVYQQAADLDPDFALVQVNLTRLHGIMFLIVNLDPSPERRAKTQAAMEAVQRAAPGSPEAHYARGMFAYYCEEDNQRALEEYGAVEAAFPNDAPLLIRIANAHRRLRQWREAYNFGQRAVALNPRDLSAGYQFGITCVAMRRYTESLELARKYGALFPNAAEMEDLRSRSQFALDGDRTAYLRALAARPAYETDPYGLNAAYDRAVLAGNYTAADNVLADPRLAFIVSLQATTTMNEPAALHRAMMGVLLGRAEGAHEAADSAIAYYRGRVWSPRQERYATLGVAQALAYSGRAGEAMALLRRLYEQRAAFDGLDGPVLMFGIGRTFVTLGMREEAFAVLRELMAGACQWSGNEIRWDPFWSRLKDDARFEEILKSAKPL